MSAEFVIGILSFGAGIVLLVTRVNPLRFGQYRFDYVMLHVALAAACMYSGLTVFAGVAQLGVLNLAVLCASVCHMSYTGGLEWNPPTYMLNDHYGKKDSLW